MNIQQAIKAFPRIGFKRKAGSAIYTVGLHGYLEGGGLACVRAEDALADDWVPARLVRLDFADAMQAAAHGHKVRRPSWGAGNYVSASDATVPSMRLYCVRGSETVGLGNYTPAAEDVLAGDWQLVDAEDC